MVKSIALESEGTGSRKMHAQLKALLLITEAPPKWRVQWWERLTLWDHFLGPLLTTKQGFFSVCRELSQWLTVCWPWVTLEGGLSSSCSESGNDPGERLCGSSLSLSMSLVSCSGGEEKRQGRAFQRREYKPDPGEWLGAETTGREGPFQVVAGKNWERGEACHPQKHLDRGEPVVMRQCVHLFNQ